jgi:putative endonuclease
MSGRFAKVTIRALDSLARLLPQRDSAPAHLKTGRRGEEEAYFYLRQHGYVIVARNYRTARSRSELDLVGWEGDTLCFIEVKTRSSRHFLPAELAVDFEKRRDLSHVARQFMRKIPDKPAFRFDIVSVYLEAGRAPDFVLFKDAFPIV